MAIDSKDAFNTALSTSTGKRPYQAYAENLPPVKSEAEIVKALQSTGPTETIRRPVLKDDELAKADPDKMTLDEVKRLAAIQAQRRAAKGGPNFH